MSRSIRFVIFIIILLTGMTGAQPPNKAPDCILDPALDGYKPFPEKPPVGISRQQLYPVAITGPDKKNRGLVIDLGDTSLFGRIYSGIFYFDYSHNDYLFPYYRESSRLKNGKGVIRIKDFVEPQSETNVNHWQDEGVVAYRLNLMRRKGKKIAPLGFHDSAVRFRYRNGIFEKALTLTEGPIVNLATSDHPDWLVISFETDRPSRGWVEVEGTGKFSDSKETIRHEIRLTNLRAETDYRYRVVASVTGDTLRTPLFSIRTAPPPGKYPVTFAYAGDSRSGNGGGEYSYMGVNLHTMRQIGAAIYRKGAEFLLFNGDMISGYTAHKEDFILEFKAFKQSLFGFLLQHPMFVAIGNHESLINRYEDGSRYGFSLDRWPYETSSVEVVLGKEFLNPENAPPPRPGLPTYRENVYSFIYGNVKFIVYNTDYWWTTHKYIPKYGGSPQGYILPGLMKWIRRQVEEGDKNPAVQYIILMSHEPVFPNGGHTEDAMWYHGDNTMRSYVGRNGKPYPEEKGIIEVRNEFLHIVSHSPKVVAVLNSDEHAYHRTLLTNRTPIGLFPRDDLNGNGKLDDGKTSPNPDIRFPLWFIVSGGAGAPYYVQEKTPWSDWVKSYSSQFNYAIITAGKEKISLKVYSLTGQLLDQVEDLSAVKKTH